MEQKGKGMMLVIIGMLGVIIAALVAGFIFLFSQINSEPGEGTIIVHEPPAVTEMDILAVNLSDSVQTNLYPSAGGTRHVVRADIGIGINNTDPDEAEEFMREMMAREIAIMDRITNILRRTTREELSTADGTDLLADRILLTLQDLFDTRMIVRVYISNLIAQ